MLWSFDEPGWPIWLRRLFKRIGLGHHWFRLDPHIREVTAAEAMSLPCFLHGCGRSGVEHWRWNGEWMLPARERWRLSLTRFKAHVRGGESK